MTKLRTLIALAITDEWPTGLALAIACTMLAALWIILP